MIGELQSRFLLLKPLGAGLTGVTWRARTLTAGDEVAVKVLHRAIVDDPGARARLAAETPVITAHLDPRIVRIREVIAGPDTIALVSELAAGDSLATLLRHSGPLPWRHAMRLAEELAAALAATHAANVVHCDLKPSNVLVTPGVGALRLTDLRTARLALGFSDGLAAFGVDGYAAPDRSGSNATSPDADVFSYGVLVAEALTGRRPEPDDPLAGLPRPIRDILAACVRKDSGSRPSADEILDRLASLPSGSTSATATGQPADAAEQPADAARQDGPQVRPAPDAPRPGGGRRRPALRKPRLVLLCVALLGVVVATAIAVAERGPAIAADDPRPTVAAHPLPAPPDALPTPDSSAEFARHWFAALDFAVQTGDTGPLRAASAASCQACEDGIAAITRAHADGGSLTGGGYDVRTVTATSFWSLEHPMLDVIFDRTPRSAAGPHSADPDGTLPGAVFVRCQVALEWRADRWLVTAVLADEVVV